MGNLAITYRHIADILSFESSNSKLELLLNDPSFNWDVIVVEGSKHLVLPAIYCRLKAKHLLHLLPEGLETYLEQITSINRNRNTSILKQVHFIAQLLKEHHIDHVFLKGAALLASGCYEDNAERMVGDIDILVSKDQLTTAFNLIKRNGYPKTFGFAYETIGFRHLDRLIAPNELAAIELHDELLIQKYGDIIDIKKVIRSKRYVDHIAIPSSYYLGLHQILAWQLNDKGGFYHTVHFKTCYDSIILKVHANTLLLLDLSKLKFGPSYLAIASYYFDDFHSILSNKKMESYKNSHLKYLINPVYKLGLKPIKQHYMYIATRLNLIIYNKFYTRHVLKKIFFKRINVF
jgi:hypothetical protein